MRDDLDYASFDGGYAQDYEDFMWHRLHYHCLLPLPILRNAAVPSHAVQCHPGKSELCVSPFILLQWPEGLYQGASSLTNSLCSYIWNCLFSVSFSLDSHTHTQTHNHVVYLLGDPASRENTLKLLLSEFCGAQVLLNVAPVKMADTVLQL